MAKDKKPKPTKEERLKQANDDLTKENKRLKQVETDLGEHLVIFQDKLSTVEAETAQQKQIIDSINIMCNRYEKVIDKFVS